MCLVKTGAIHQDRLEKVISGQTNNQVCAQKVYRSTTISRIGEKSLTTEVEVDCQVAGYGWLNTFELHDKTCI